MLGSHKIIAFVATRDALRAKVFYRDTLGLRLVSEEPFALVFDAQGTMLRVSIVQQLAPAKHTVLGWDVPDIMAAAQDLQKAGVRFERYEGLPQDELGIWTAPGGGGNAACTSPIKSLFGATIERSNALVGNRRTGWYRTVPRWSFSTSIRSRSSTAARPASTILGWNSNSRPIRFPPWWTSAAR